jgi:GNAT superfamily N-acetyltransferase
MAGHDRHRGWLYYVATAPDCQSQGIGRQMVAAGEEWLRDRKVVKVMLLVQTPTRGLLIFTTTSVLRPYRASSCRSGWSRLTKGKFRSSLPYSYRPTFWVTITPGLRNAAWPGS